MYICAYQGLLPHAELYISVTRVTASACIASILIVLVNDDHAKGQKHLKVLTSSLAIPPLQHV